MYVCMYVCMLYYYFCVCYYYYYYYYCYYDSYPLNQPFSMLLQGRDGETVRRMANVRLVLMPWLQL